MTAPGTPPPVWLGPAVALARWTQEARAADSTASRQLRRLRRDSEWLAARTQPIATLGEWAPLEVGAVPQTPTDSEIARWARDAWERAIAAGSRAERELATHARRLLSAGEAALARVTRAAAAATDAALGTTLRNVEAGLRAILRPTARGLATVVSAAATPVVLIGLAALAVYLGSRRGNR